MLKKKDFNLKAELPPVDIVQISMLLRAPQYKVLNEKFCSGKMDRGDIKALIKDMKRISDSARAQGDTAMENNTRKVAADLEALLKG